MSEGLKRIMERPAPLPRTRVYDFVAASPARPASVDRVVCRILSDRPTDERVFTEKDPFERSQLTRERWSIGIRLLIVDDLIKFI